MPGVAHQQSRREPAPDAVDDHERLRQENIVLVERLTRMRRALERATIENDELRRALAEMRIENRSRAVAHPNAAVASRTERIRTMLRDRSSRNP